MTHVVTSPCIGTKSADCVDACPVTDCIRESPGQYFIDPDRCIDCGSCISACPVNAIFPDADVPDQDKNYIPLNQELARKYPAES